MTAILPMLSVDSKKTDNIVFMKPLKTYITAEFGKQCFELHTFVIEELEKMREEIRLSDSADKTEMGRDKLLRYHGLVKSMEKRFPVNESNIRLNFYWYDAYTKKRAAQYNLSFEKAAITFNIGALESQIANLHDRSNEEGLKNACKYFSMAAGTFGHLREQLQFSPQLAATPDLSADFLTLLENLMLGQAQECFYDKAARSGMKSAILAKLAAQVATFYTSALALVASFPHVKGAFEGHLILRQFYFLALTNFYMADDAFSRDRYGEQVGYLEHANQLITNVNLQKLLKNAAVPLREMYAQKTAIIGNALRVAANDNSKIYHEMVPREMPQVEGKAMVKAAEFPNTTLPPEHDPFRALVPFAINQSLSIYNEKKSELVRNYTGKIEENNNLTKSSLCSMNLPGAIQALDNPGGIPRELQERITKFKQAGGVNRVRELLEALNSLAQADEEILNECQNILDKEEEEDNAANSQYKERWNRTPSHQLTPDLRQDMARYRGNYEHARKSDAYVQKKFQESSSLLVKLSGTDAEILSLLPQVERPSAVSQSAVAALKQLLRRLDDLIARRETLQTELKQIRDHDDISASLMGAQGPHEAVFGVELQKYDDICRRIDENLASQDQLLSEISDANAEFVQSKAGSSSAAEQRERAMQQIDQAFSYFNELQANLAEGIKFYTNFQELLTKLQAKCEDYAFARKTEKQDLISKMTLAAAAPLAASPVMAGGMPSSYSGVYMQPYGFDQPIAGGAPPSYNPSYMQPLQHLQPMQGVPMQMAPGSVPSQYGYSMQPSGSQPQAQPFYGQLPPGAYVTPQGVVMLPYPPQ